jgi:hypothetical protein
MRCDTVIRGVALCLTEIVSSQELPSESYGDTAILQRSIPPTITHRFNRGIAQHLTSQSCIRPLVMKNASNHDPAGEMRQTAAGSLPPDCESDP